MKRLLVATALLFIFGTASAQNTTDFLIDKTKPYVYLKFEELGTIVYSTGERVPGLRLKVINNCRLPIVFSGDGRSNGEVGMRDHVYAEHQEGIKLIGNYSPLHTFSDKEEYERAKAATALPDPEEQERQKRLKKMPKLNYFDFAILTVVQPGEEALFSIPRNHVSPDWYTQIEFTLDVGDKTEYSGPYTTLEFHESEIPKSARDAESTPTQPAKP